MRSVADHSHSFTVRMASFLKCMPAELLAAMGNMVDSSQGVVLLAAQTLDVEATSRAPCSQRGSAAESTQHHHQYQINEVPMEDTDDMILSDSTAVSLPWKLVD